MPGAGKIDVSDETLAWWAIAREDFADEHAAAVLDALREEWGFDLRCLVALMARHTGAKERAAAFTVAMENAIASGLEKCRNG